MRDWLVDIRLKQVALAGAALGFVAIAFLSLMPAPYRPDIGGVSDKVEHALAYLLLGTLTTIAIRKALNPNRLAVAIIAYGGVLELVQLLIPSRVASLEDFVASAAGAIAGVSIGALLSRLPAMQRDLPSGPG